MPSFEFPSREFPNLQRTEEEIERTNDRLKQLEASLEAAQWGEKFRETIEKGGVSEIPFPYDFDGVWLLALNSDPDSPFLYEPVLSEEDLHDGIESKRRIVSSDEVVVGECVYCHQEVPLLGRGSAQEYGMGDVTSKTEIAIIHCYPELQLQEAKEVDNSDKNKDFNPHKFPENYNPETFVPERS